MVCVARFCCPVCHIALCTTPSSTSSSTLPVLLANVTTWAKGKSWSSRAGFDNEQRTSASGAALASVKRFDALPPKSPGTTVNAVPSSTSASASTFPVSVSHGVNVSSGSGNGVGAAMVSSSPSVTPNRNAHPIDGSSSVHRPAPVAAVVVPMREDAKNDDERGKRIHRISSAILLGVCSI